jgi:protein-tyrosine phosphatase
VSRRGADQTGMKVLFVCTGNECRSAAAERLLAARAATLVKNALDVRSTGTRAVPGRPVHRRTAAALAKRGVPVDGFTSRRLTADDVDAADLILTMTAEHREEVVAVNPRGLRRIFTLREAAALCAQLPAALLAAVPPPERGRALAEVLDEARAVHRRLPGSADIDDPVGRSRRQHARVVDEIDEALAPLVRTLVTRHLTDAPVRIHQLPPVPAVLPRAN